MSQPSISWSSVTRTPVTASHDFQNHESADDCEDPRQQYAHKLVAYLAPVAVEAADGFPLPINRIDDHSRAKCP